MSLREIQKKNEKSLFYFLFNFQNIGSGRLVKRKMKKLWPNPLIISMLWNSPLLMEYVRCQALLAGGQVVFHRDHLLKDENLSCMTLHQKQLMFVLTTHQKKRKKKEKEQPTPLFWSFLCFPPVVFTLEIRLTCLEKFAH